MSSGAITNALRRALTQRGSAAPAAARRSIQTSAPKRGGYGDEPVSSPPVPSPLTLDSLLITLQPCLPAHYWHAV